MDVLMYRKMYTQLFNAVTDALACMAKDDFYEAMTLLKAAQRDTEQTFILWEENRTGKE